MRTLLRVAFLAVGSLALFGIFGCASQKPKTYEQILTGMTPEERQRVEIEVSEYEAYANYKP